MAEHLRVAGVISQQGNDWSDICNAVADAYGFPPRLIVACGWMESNWDEHSERRGVPPDVSAGVFHQTVKWAVGYGLGDGSHTPENIAHVFHALKTDVPRAADIAGQQLGRWWRQEHAGLEALSRYNSPGLAWAQNPNKANIQRGWDASAAYVVGEEAPMPDWLADVRAEFPYANGEYQERPLSAIEGVTYHHGASAMPAPTYDAEMAMLQAYHRLHTETHGWPAIGYALAVGSSGTVYWLNGLELVTYHAGAANAAHVGICLIGDFTHGPPSAVMIDAARRARSWVAQQVGQADLPYSGHADHMATSCPGASWWPEHRDWLAGLPDDAAPEPEPPPEPEPVPDPWAEVARLNAELAACRSWSGALDAHVIKPGFALLDAAITTGDLDRARKRGRDRVAQVRALLAEHGGLPE